MSDYRIICVVRGRDGGLRALGYSESGNGVMYDGRWTLDQARSALKAGHHLYTINPHTGGQTSLELFHGSVEGRIGWDDSLDDLPECG